MNKKLLLIPLALLLALSLVAIGCPTTPTTTPPTTTPPTTTPPTTTPKYFDIGVIEGLSGQFSEMSKKTYDGIPIAVEIINEQGGITVNGQQYLINLIVEDSKNTPEGVVAAATKLVYDRKVKFIAGTSMGALVRSELTITNPAGVVTSHIFNNGLASDCSADNPLVLKAASGTVELAAGLIRYLAAHYPDAKTVLNIMPDDGAIAEVGPKVAKFVEDAGLTMAGDTIGWSLDTVDFYPIAQKCIARNADAWLINPGYEAMVAQFLRAGREQGYTGVVTGTSGAFHNLLQVSGDDPNVCTGIFLPGFSVQSVEEVRALPDDMFTPLFKQIGEKAITEYGFYDPDLLKGFDCLYCLVQAIEEAQSFDPEVVAATWKTMDTMETSWGPGRMCGIETFGVNNVVGPYRPIQIIENGVMTYGGMVDMSIP